MPEKHVKDIMTASTISVQKTEPLQNAVDLMAEKNISCVVVKDENRLAGLITERDLVHRVLHKKQDITTLTAEDIMTQNISTISEEATLEEAMRIIESLHIRRLPVVGENGLSGLITQTDIVNEAYEIQKHNLKMQKYFNLWGYIIIAFFVIMGAFFFITRVLM